MTTETDTDAGQPAHDTPAPEGQDNPVERIAKQMGWSPEDQWRGPKDKWQPAEDFLLRTPDVLRDLKDSNKRVIQATKAIIDKERVKAVKEAEERYAKAREDNDIDAALQAKADLDEAKRPDPSIAEKQAAFARENPWFDKDDTATAIAMTAADRVAKRGGDVDEQMEMAVKAVKKAMPELFDPDPEERPSRSEPKAPSMQGGQRTSQTQAPRETWDALPADVRKEMQSAFVKTGMLTTEECAKAYWQEQKQ